MGFKLKVGPPQGLKLKGNAGFALPLIGGAGIATAKSGGLWTVSLNFSEVQEGSTVNDDTAYILTWDSATELYTRLTVTGFKSEIQGDLAAVAISGDYDDLTNTPTLGTAAAADTTDFATAAQGTTADTAVQPGDLGALAVEDAVTSALLAADVFSTAHSWSGVQTFTNPVVGTQSPGDNSTKAASTAYVEAAVTAGTAGVASINGETGALTLSNGVTNSGADIRLAPGAVIDSAYAEYTLNTDIASAIPIDDTIPQNTEGVEILSLSITPKSATNKLRVRFVGLGTPSGNANMAVALFLNSEAGARAARYTATSAGFAQIFGLEFEFVPGATSSQTLKIRAGVSSGTMRFNGTASARIFGGVLRTTLIVEEVIV